MPEAARLEQSIAGKRPPTSKPDMTAVHHKLPIKVVIFKNSALGLITLLNVAPRCGPNPTRSPLPLPGR